MPDQPRLDITATLRRQFIVDIGVQFVFGDGNLWVGHGRRLCPGSIENGWSAGRENRLRSNAFTFIRSSTCTMLAIINLPSFDPPQCRPLALDRGLDLGGGPAELRHQRADR